MSNQDHFRNSDLDRAKTKRNIFHLLVNEGLKRHRSDTGLVEDRTSSVTIVRIIVGLLLIHLIIIGGVLLRGQMVKDMPGSVTVATPVAPPPGTASPVLPPAPGPIVQNTLPQATPKPTAPARVAAANHITQTAQDEEVAVAVEDEVEAVIIAPPIVAEKPAAPATPLRHLVAPGDTIYRISNQYGITEAELKAANPSLQHGILRSGVTLTIPTPGQATATAAHSSTAAPAQADSKPKVYIVRRGDTLSGISAKTRVKVDTLKELNGIKDPRRISPGMELRLSR